jgi:hypothetical protein
MKTLTVTEGRGRLGYWLRRALQGEDVGFAVDGRIVGLRPVTVHSEDYALQEYGLSAAEMKKTSRRIRKVVAAERKRGTLKTFDGTVDALRD